MVEVELGQPTPAGLPAQVAACYLAGMDAPGIVPESINCHACNAPFDLAGQPGFTQVECPHCQAISVIPLQFGNLLLLNPLGVGGMGTVYKALDLQLNRYVAVKILRSKFAGDPQFITAFAREARAAAAINHPNIAQVYAFTEQEGQYCLTMELLERGSLDDRITKLGKLPEADVLAIGAGIAGGLRAAHQREMLHRDIKPGNILFNDEGVAKLVDFGLAGAQHEATGPGANVIWGTPYYIAPEKLRGLPEDFHSDMYSLGATLFHALAGRPPFDAQTAAEVLALHASAPAFNLKTYNPTVQDYTAQVIGRMLAKEPTERFLTYDALIQELNQAEQRRQANQSAAGLVTESGERIPIVSLIATIAAILAAGVLVTFLWFNREKLGIETSARPAVTNRAVSKEIPRPPVVAEVIDFNEMAPWANSWSNALANLALDNIQGALAECENLKQLTRGQPHHRRWAWLLEGVTLLAAGRGVEAVPIFQKAADPTVPPATPENITPTSLVNPLTALLLDNLPVSTTTNWPGWAAGFFQALVGFQQLSAGQLEAARGTLIAYQKLPVDPNQPWAFALQPLARKRIDEISQLPATRTEINRLQQTGKLDAALQLLRATRSRTGIAAFRAQLDTDEAAILKAQQAAQQKVAVAQRAAAEEARRRATAAQSQQQVDAEIAQVQALETSLHPIVNNYDFQTALTKSTELEPRLTTPAAKRLLEQRCATLRRLVEFKKQLIGDLATKPFEASQIVTRSGRVEGQLTHATETDLTFTVPYGELPAAWHDLTPATLQKMGEFYAQIGKPTDRARRYLDTAILAKQFNLKFADDLKLAVQFDPTLQAEIDSGFSK